MITLSLIVPCYNEQEVLPLFYQETSLVLKKLKNISAEFIFVDDGSQDQTLPVIKRLRHQDNRVRYVSFSRNFGKEAAIYAGLQKATGDLVVIMDADLQDPPTLLPDMIDAVLQQGYDSVATKRATRKGEPKIRSFFADLFYRFINSISKIKITPGARDFRLMTRQMADAVLNMCEYNRFTKGIYPWVGFKTKWLAYDNIQRAAGQTKWSFWKLFIYSLEGITAFSTVPLALASFTGVFFCLLSFLGIFVVVLRKLIWDGSAYGWASMVCILFFISGIQLFCTGILGQYLSKTYLETKRRPLYILKETEQTNSPLKKPKNKK